METQEQNIIIPEQKESLKLFKLTKGFNWEIKLVGNIDDAQIERLKNLNQKMQEEYGGSSI